MKNILVLCLMLISVCAISQTEQNATNSEVRGHDVTYYAAATCGLFSGTNPYTGQLTPKTNQTGVGAFVLSNAAIGDILVTNIGLYEIKATDNASSPTVTIQLINNPALANTAFPPTGDVAVIRPTSKGLLPSYISDGVIGLPFTTEAFIGNFNASQIDYQLSSLSSDKVLIPLVNNDGLAGKAVTINSSGEATLVDTSSAIAAIGIVETIDGATANVVTSGRVTITGHSFTIGDRLYLSETAGELTTVQYDESSQPMAYVEDANTLIVSPNAFHSAATAGGGGTPLADADQTLAAPRTITGTSTNTLTFDSGTADGTPDVIFNDAITIQGNTKISSGTNPLGTSVIIGANTAPNLNSANNVIIGDSAFFNVAGGATVPDNVIIGGSAGVENTVGRYLTLVGAWAGHDNRTGLDNTAFGQLSLQYNQDGNFNTAFGYGAGRRFRADSTGGKGLSSENIFFGWGTGYGPITGPFNTGYRNLFVGYQTGFHWQTGNDNTLIGHRSGENGNGADWNVSVGARSLLRLTTGDYNIGLGAFALQNIDVGIRNIGIGYNSGYNNSNGSDNIVIGNNMATSSASASNEVILGFNGTEKLTYNKATNDIWEFQGGMEINSTSNGFLPPRLTTTERDLISSPSAGLIIYNTTTNKHQGYNGTIWNDFY